MKLYVPSVHEFRFLPDDLTERDQWVLWRWEARGGKPTKVPYQVNGSRASIAEPKTWTSFVDECLEAEKSVKPWARGIVERFADTYVEISPSGTGIKIWARGSLPGNVPGVAVGDGQIELYDHARYFTVTGGAFRGAPREIEDHATDLLPLYERLTGRGGKSWPLQPLEGGRIPYGRQHNTLVSIAGTLRARRVCDEAIEACLQIMNERQCERPGPRQNISRIVRSSRQWDRKA